MVVRSCRRRAAVCRTSSFVLCCACCIRLSMAMNAPVLPTPALCRHTDKHRSETAAQIRDSCTDQRQMDRSETDGQIRDRCTDQRQMHRSKTDGQVRDRWTDQRQMHRERESALETSGVSTLRLKQRLGYTWGWLERLAYDQDAWRALVGGLCTNRGRRQ